MSDLINSGLSQFISAVGFPIVVAIALYYQNNSLSAGYQKLTQQLQDKIDNNTLVLTRLVEKLHEDVLLDEQNIKTNNEKTDKK